MSRSAPLLLSALGLLAAAAGPASAQSLLRDIDPATVQGSVFPTGPLLVDGNRVWLTAGRTSFSSERTLLISDGTRAGTEWLDFFTSSEGLFPNQLVRLDSGRVVYRARDLARGVELHASDGTPAGSRLVLDVFPGQTSSMSDQVGNLRLFSSLGNQLVFAADDGVHGTELWTSDGTPAGTQLLLDLRPGPASSAPSLGAHLGNQVVFAAFDGTAGFQPWLTDGTAAGTRLLAQINPNGNGIPLADFTEFGSLVVFTGDDGVSGREPWITDGTPGGTRMLADLEPGPRGSQIREIRVHGNRCYLTVSNSTVGPELYVTDGTSITFLGDLDGSRFGSGPGGLTPVGPDLAFVARDFTNGSELWWTDGTPGGTRRVTDLIPGAGSATGWQLGSVGNLLVFVVETPALGLELWVSDGTTAGTQPLVDIRPGTESSRPNLLGNFGGEFWFNADDGVHGRELWATDGTTAGTRMLFDLAPAEPADSFPAELTQIGNRAVFAATDATHGRELWVTDGSSGGTQLLVDLAPGADHSVPSDFHRIGNRAVFKAFTPGNGNELWATNGAPGGTRQMRQIDPGPGSSSAEHFTEFGGFLYFSARDPNGRTLWRTDGTFVGTTRVGPTALSVTFFDERRPLHALPDRLLILTPQDIWTCDGNGPATRLGITAPGTIGDTAGVVVDDELFFLATANDVKSLWVTNGTPAGTRKLGDLQGPCSSLDLAAEFAVRDGLAYVAVRDQCTQQGDPVGGTGRELWVSDGTVAGTRQLADVWPGAASGEVLDLVATPGKVFFSALGDQLGRELWSTDGTATGTVPLADPLAGFRSSVYVPQTVQVGAGNRVVYAAADDAHGRELWISDGTPGGTTRLTDLAPGPTDSIAPGFRLSRTTQRPLLLGDQLLFAADDGATGIELFALPAQRLEAALLLELGSGCPGDGGRTPRLGTTGVPARGQSFGVTVDEAVPSSSATLLVGVGRQDLTLPGGCVVHPRQPAFGLPAPISPAGTGSVGFTIPANDPSLVGLRLVMQWAVLDPSGAFQNVLAFSPGLRVTLGES